MIYGNENDMKPTYYKCKLIAFTFLIAVYLIVNLSGCSNPVQNNTFISPELGQNTPVKSDTLTAVQTNTDVIQVSVLPSEARTTLQLIKSGGPFPYSKDGTVFNNYEGLLPDKPSGYYHEYTVITTGSQDRGSRRIISGANNEYFYTDDHYKSFKKIME
jgi:ribonuclease T1